MGCFWSSQASRERCTQCPRRAAKNMRIEDGICEVCTYQARRSAGTTAAVKPQQSTPAKYGEYKCSCGRYWNSLLARPGRYQQCKSCNKKVYAQEHTMREIRSSDLADDPKNVKKHATDLCETCQELGRHCKETTSKLNTSRTKTKSRKTKTSSFSYRPKSSTFRTKKYTSRTKATRRW